MPKSPAPTTARSIGKAESGRFHSIDSLRGIAAMAVVVHHLLIALSGEGPLGAGSLIRIVGEGGRYGVEIFFVISGFVIAHSTRNGDYSAKYLGLFIARRAIRLDVPYWATIAVEVGLLALSGYAMPEYPRALPEPGQLVANMFYAQGLLGYPHILPIFWTLCYEVQFYLFFVSLLVISHKYAHRLSQIKLLRETLLIASFIGSLVLFSSQIVLPVSGLFIDRWFQFLLGVLAYRVLLLRAPPYSLAIALAASLVSAALIAGTYRSFSIVASCLTVAVVLASFRSRHLKRIFEQPILLWLGALSYSIYLLHLSVGWRVVVLAKRFSGLEGLSLVTLSLAGGILATLVAAWLMHTLIEKPAIQIAHRVKLPRASPA